MYTLGKDNCEAPAEGKEGEERNILTCLTLTNVFREDVCANELLFPLINEGESIRIPLLARFARNI